MNLERYLRETKLLNYSCITIQKLINERKWKQLDDFNKIKATYSFVRDEILFGYNVSDEITAEQVLKDGYGQCNTKGILFMALLRAINLPCRIHGFTIDKELQKGAMTGIVYRNAPQNVLHSWVEVFYNEKWYELEAFILDKKYLSNLQKKFKQCSGAFCGYGVAVKDFKNPQVDWEGNNTYIQSEGINQDLGIYDSPDELFKVHHQEMSKAKEILSYDISFDSLRNIANSYFNSLKVNPDENNEQVNEEINNTENNNTQEVINSEVINETQEGIGGTDEPEQTAEEKTQEQLDIEYIKQNINIIWPLTGVITSGFGTRTPTDIVSANHYGIDIAGNIGDSIIAAVDGTVTLASSQGDYGNHLKIENGEIATLYAHCNKLYVEEGATVKQGDKIAEVGETGRATGPHLHFEIRRQDRFVNPEEILS